MTTKCLCVWVVWTLDNLPSRNIYWDPDLFHVSGIKDSTLVLTEKDHPINIYRTRAEVLSELWPQLCNSDRWDKSLRVQAKIHPGGEWWTKSLAWSSPPGKQEKSLYCVRRLSCQRHASSGLCSFQDRMVESEKWLIEVETALCVPTVGAWIAVVYIEEILFGNVVKYKDVGARVELEGMLTFRGHSENEWRRFVLGFDMQEKWSINFKARRG